jgi:hypothetical protein
LSYGIQKSKTLESVRALNDYGYVMFSISDVGAEYGFIDQRTSAQT